MLEQDTTTTIIIQVDEDGTSTADGPISLVQVHLLMTAGTGSTG